MCLQLVFLEEKLANWTILYCNISGTVKLKYIKFRIRTVTSEFYLDTKNFQFLTWLSKLV